MITLAIIEQLTPERIKTLSLEEKREALAMLEALELPRMERVRRRWLELPKERREASVSGLESVLQEKRRKFTAMTPAEQQADRERREKDLAEWEAWREKRAPQKPFDAKAEWLKLRETNPRAGGIAIDRLLGVPTPEQPDLPQAEEQNAKLPRLVPLTEIARRAQEQAFAEANREEPDFITRICGEGSKYPSGRRGGRFGFMA